MEHAMHFDGIAASYSRAKPPYPADLWRDVVATGLVTPGRRALDLGAGSGEATGELLARGMDVVAVEPGARLGQILSSRFPRATVIRSRAEDLSPVAASFDLAVAATSIHWMDLEIVLPVVHGALREDGRLLVWRNVFGDDAAAQTPFRREVEAIVERRGETRASDAESAAATAEKLARRGLFRIDELHHYRWSARLTADQVRALFGTFSNWAPDEVEQAASAVDRLGGSVTEHYTSWLIGTSPQH